MHVKKLLFQKLGYISGPNLTPRDPQANLTFVPQEDCKQSRWYLSQCAPERDIPACVEIKNHPGHK